MDRHERTRAAFRSLAASRGWGRAAGVRPVKGSAYPHAYRLRLGPFRILFTYLPGLKTLVATTAFRKKRDADYAAALRRHDLRVNEFE